MCRKLSRLKTATFFFPGSLEFDAEACMHTSYDQSTRMCYSQYNILYFVVGFLRLRRRLRALDLIRDLRRADAMSNRFELELQNQIKNVSS